MKKEMYKHIIVPTIYVLAVIAFVISMFYIQKALTDMSFSDNKDFEYVSKDSISNDNKPVVSSNVTIIKPYTDEQVKIVKNFYDYQGEAADQEKAIIYYDTTYMQNSGVDYQSSASFNVVSILDGTIIDVKEDELLGKIVQVRHSNDMISIYQSLSEVNVKKDDAITQGTIIGKSGTCNIDKELNDHLHFELFYKGKVVNPESFYDKKVKEL